MLMVLVLWQAELLVYIDLSDTDINQKINKKKKEMLWGEQKANLSFTAGKCS